MLENCESEQRKRDWRFREKLCLWYVMLGRKPGYRHTSQYIPIDDLLGPLVQRFPNFLDLISDKTIIDFGCAKGDQTFALAEAEARRVVGVEILENRLSAAKERLSRLPPDAQAAQKIEFCQFLDYRHAGQFDLAISLNSLEHFADPEQVLKEIFDALRPGGELFITFGPPWFSAYGPHQMEYTMVPWPHLIFDELTVMKVRGFLLEDTKETYADRWLNQMSIGKFEQLVKDSKFGIKKLKYNCSKKLDFLQLIPVFRELCINNVTCILKK